MKSFTFAIEPDFDMISKEDKRCEECGEFLMDHDGGECPRKSNEDDFRLTDKEVELYAEYEKAKPYIK